MIQSPELQARLAILRQKLADKTATMEDMKEGLRLMRSGRVSASYSAEGAKRAKAKKAIPDGDSLLEQLEGL